MRKPLQILSIILALAMIFGVCSFASAEKAYGNIFEKVYGEAAAVGEAAAIEKALKKAAADNAAAEAEALYFSRLAELSDDVDILSYLAKDFPEDKYTVFTDFLEMDKRAGLIAELEPVDDEYPLVAFYCFINPEMTLYEYAAKESALCNAVLYPIDKYGLSYGYVSYDVVSDDPYYSYNVLTELENGSILKVVYQHKAKRVSVGHSSKSFCVPDDILAEEAEPKEENEIAEYSIAPISDTISRTPVLIQVYEKVMDKDQQFYDAVVQLADEQKADISFVTRGQQEYILLVKENDDGDNELGFCFEEDGRFYELCFTTAEDGLPMVSAVSNSLA